MLTRIGQKFNLASEWRIYASDDILKNFIFFLLVTVLRVKGQQTKLCCIDFDFSKITIVIFWEAKFISCVLFDDTQFRFRVHALLPK